MKLRGWNGYQFFVHNISVLLTLLSITVVVASCGSDEKGPPINDAHGPFVPMEIALQEQGELKELIRGDLKFTDAKGVEWVAPNGTLTDGATVPRLALPITDGRWDSSFLKAAVVHDAYCQKENEHITPAQYRKRPWQDVHLMFYEATVAGGTSTLLAKIMLAGVWFGGPRWKNGTDDSIPVSTEVLTRGFTSVKKWIEEEEPTVAEITADISRREPVLVTIDQYETKIAHAFSTGNVDKANSLLREEASFLSRKLEQSPKDSMLLVSKGYLHKNKAITMQKMGSIQGAQREIISSERAFNAAIDSVSDNRGASLGLENISTLRENLHEHQLMIESGRVLAPDNVRTTREFERINE